MTEKNVIFTGRGKTTSLLHECAESNARMVVPNMASVSDVMHLAKLNDLDIPKPMTHEEFISGKTGVADCNVCIDNVEMLLETIASKRNLKVVACSGDYDVFD